MPVAIFKWCDILKSQVSCPSSKRSHVSYEEVARYFTIQQARPGPPLGNFSHDLFRVNLTH